MLKRKLIIRNIIAIVGYVMRETKRFIRYHTANKRKRSIRLDATDWER